MARSLIVSQSSSNNLEEYQRDTAAHDNEVRFGIIFPYPAVLIACFQATTDTSISATDGPSADAGTQPDTLLNMPGFLRSVAEAPGQSLPMIDEGTRQGPNVLPEALHLGSGPAMVSSLG